MTAVVFVAVAIVTANALLGADLLLRFRREQLALARSRGAL